MNPLLLGARETVLQLFAAIGSANANLSWEVSDLSSETGSLRSEIEDDQWRLRDPSSTISDLRRGC